MTPERSLTTARVVSSVAAVVIALACGTNYVYSAWGPQFADKLKLSSTQSNIIGAAGNLGMYSMGIPVGMFVDNRGPRPAVIGGSFLLALGYFPLRLAYNRGSASVAACCFYTFCTGFGGCCAFAASIKTSALNWPRHRGTATAFPLAGFGLSAFFFSIFAEHIFPGSTGDFLLLLAAGTFGMTFISFFFLRVVPQSPYSPVHPTDTLNHNDSNPLLRTPSQGSHISQSHFDGISGHNDHDIGASISVSVSTVENPNSNPSQGSGPAPGASNAPQEESNETSSLMTKGSSCCNEDLEDHHSHTDRAHRVDIRGFKLFKHSQFYFLFSLMGLLTGIGLMTINNIGNDAAALWRHYDDSVTDTFINGRQAMHVSILSIGSFVGRLLSGVGSDFLVKHLHASRTWCLTIAAVVFTIAQILAISIETPYYLVLVSSLSGLAYGFLFGVFPSLVAEAFGIHGMSQNWGCITMAPIISGNIFNLFYGIVLDSNSIIGKDGARECDMGRACYRSAYVLTLVTAIAAVIISLVSIWHHKHERAREEATGKLVNHEA